MRTCTIEKIAAELTRRFKASDSPNTCVLTMKHDNKALVLTLCSATDRVMTADSNLELKDFDYVLVDGGGIAHTMGGTPDDVCRQLQNYEALAAEYADDVRRITEYCEEHKNEQVPCCESDAYQLFSDWHKDLFGHRPNGWTVNYKNW